MCNDKACAVVSAIDNLVLVSSDGKKIFPVILEWPKRYDLNRLKIKVSFAFLYFLQFFESCIFYPGIRYAISGLIY